MGLTAKRQKKIIRNLEHAKGKNLKQIAVGQKTKYISN